MSSIRFSIDNQALACRFELDGELFLSALEDKTRPTALISRRLPFCQVEGGQGFHFSDERPREASTLLFIAHQEDILFELQVSIQESRLRWQLSGGGSDRPCRLRFPFLEALSPGEQAAASRGLYLHMEERFRERDFILPAAWGDPAGRMQTLLVHQPYGEPVYAVQDLWQGAGVPKSLTQEMKVLFSGELSLHDGGLRASFDLFRQSVRSQFDLSQYQREDLTWTRELILQHFTFLYGGEILDLERGHFDIDRLLDEGENSFGGYDSLVLWGHYPRLGIDERTQWDFYDDFPGGRAKLRALSARARQRGARVFVPYLPWDNSARLHGYEQERDEVELARLVRDIDADGVFLDCMAAIRGEYRTELDKAKAGVMICSEGRAKGEALQLITGCWEQSQSRDWMQGNWTASAERLPGVDLWRFIFPEQHMFVISRFTTAEDRKRIIQRGFFNGMGWVVWQNIFGLRLPFTPPEAALLKKCRAILRDYSPVVWGESPTPLLPVLQPDVYCNEFCGGGKRLWLFYNDSAAHIQGPVLPLDLRSDLPLMDVWNGHEVALVDGCLPVTLEPYQVGAVVEAA